MRMFIHRNTIMNDSDEEWVYNLGFAIVYQACLDYENYLNHLERTVSYQMATNIQHKIMKIIKFFHTEWYSDLCRIDRWKILSRLNKRLLDRKELVKKYPEFCKLVTSKCIRK